MPFPCLPAYGLRTRRSARAALFRVGTSHARAPTITQPFAGIFRCSTATAVSWRCRHSGLLPGTVVRPAYGAGSHVRPEESSRTRRSCRRQRRRARCRQSHRVTTGDGRCQRVVQTSLATLRCHRVRCTVGVSVPRSTSTNGMDQPMTESPMQREGDPREVASVAPSTRSACRLI